MNVLGESAKHVSCSFGHMTCATCFAGGTWEKFRTDCAATRMHCLECMELVPDSDVIRLLGDDKGAEYERLKCERAVVKVECSICCDEKSAAEYASPIAAGCTHKRTVCSKCVGRHIAAEVMDKGNMQPTCPQSGCKCKLAYEEVREAFA
jgi:hypothetical protein